MMPLVLLMIIPMVRGDQIKLSPINNPILPFSLGSARITTHKHSFIKYINLDKFDEPLKQIKTNLKSMTPSIRVKDELYPQLNHVHEYLEYLLKQAELKLTNIKPQKHIRNKRGLLNIVGKGYKWAFGVLDNDDAERYDNAISTLENNQKTLHHDLENYLTISKQFMNESLMTFSKITKNQNLISKQMRTLESNLNKFTLFLKIQNYLDVMIMDCQNLITILDNIQNSILFANLETVHSVILPLDELKQLIDLTNNLYEGSLPRFENLQSYYNLVKVEVHYSKNNICFIFHFPILQENLYNYYHLYPIPIKNQTLIPPKSFIVLNSTYHHYEDNPCPVIEDTCIYHVTQQISQNNCIPKILLGSSNQSCQTTDVYVEQDIVEPINDAYIIIIPANKITIEKQCNEHGYEEVTLPQLIYLPQRCSVSINGYTYDNSLPQTQEMPLELLPVIMEQPNPTDAQWTPIQKVSIDRLTDIQRLAEKTQLHKLQSLQKDDTNNIILYICIMLILIIILFIIYRLVVKNKIEIIKYFTMHKKQGDETQKTEDSNNPTLLFSS